MNYNTLYSDSRHKLTYRSLSTHSIITVRRNLEVELIVERMPEKKYLYGASVIIVYVNVRPEAEPS